MINFKISATSKPEKYFGTKINYIEFIFNLALPARGYSFVQLILVLINTKGLIE